MKITPIVVLWLWIVSGALLGFSCYYGGKRSADRWYKAHTGDIWAPASNAITAGRVYLKNQNTGPWPKKWMDEEGAMTVRVRGMDSIPRVCSVPGDAFVYRRTGYLYVCSEKHWTWAIPPVHERDGKQ